METIKCDKCSSANITTIGKAKRTTGKPVRGRKVSYGYFYDEHTCNDCNNIFEIRK